MASTYNQKLALQNRSHRFQWLFSFLLLTWFLVENALYLDSRHTVHYLVFLVVIRVQSSMKCIICFVLRSSGKFKTRSGVTLILGCCFFMISQVQLIMRHCVHNLFSNLTRKYIYMPLVIESGFNSYQCMMNTWRSGWLKIQMNIYIPRFSSVKWNVRSIAISDKMEEWSSWNIQRPIIVFSSNIDKLRKLKSKISLWI